LIAYLAKASPDSLPALADSYTTLQTGLAEMENAMLAAYLDPRNPSWWGMEPYFAVHPIQDPANQAKLWDYLLNRRPDGRRPDEMVYSLRNSVLSATDVEANFWKLRRRPAPFISPRVLNGFLELANTASDTAFVETLLKEHAQVTITNDLDLAAFYRALRLPNIAPAVKKSKVAQDSICSIMRTATKTIGYDDLGDVVARAVPIVDCQTLIQGL
jgi:hypothetical protein